MQVNEMVVQGENAVTLMQHLQAMTQQLRSLREAMVLQEQRIADLECENEELRLENDTLRKTS